MRIKIVLAMAVLMLLAGCTASTLDILQKSATLSLSGQQVDVLTVDAGAPAGLNTRGEYLFDSKGNLLSHQVSGSPGIVTGAFQGSVGMAAVGAGTGAGLALQGGTRITNAVAGSVQSQGQRGTVKGVNTQAQGQGQAQGQLQGQAQGQLQNQGQLQQDHPVLSPGTVF